MPYLERPDARLFYADYPAPPAAEPASPVLLVHGLWCTAEGWIYQIPALSARHRTVAVDLRGHGRSSRPESGYELGDYADDLAALIRDLDLAPVVVLAHSMGASIATVLAVRHPDLVRALVMIDPDYAGEPGERERMSRLAEDLDGPDADLVAQEMIRTRFDTQATPAHLRAWHELEILASPARLRARTFRHSAFGRGSVRFRPEGERMLRERPQPVLAFHRSTGRAAVERDCMTHDYGEVILRPRAGHFIHQELADEVNGTVARWVAGLPR
ncbi:alpha/beta fold hydrolase [Streptosporangium roseum]|uniref:Hydrolase or acyltransferase (Alpha/beta hydrolase superfamily)-like protein n=1 Tax=Streptosporangium roseum (strain ATCC 12428 / DSM 43021 / JCM 3005 / KCTC 9067 / NCIMB 10171 / NRRL 2505 / NI 9100) TaxID=479432 RepID=D2B1T6_STRRD|nr:alpha/beta fold hydrolase [Streptosporangium roseum]ACZ87388.1 hydrolase or acyltransferase (alpha/beta hydrolase superfamily)-like protein [Streptosporangium roseum DSM 43021]